MINRRNFLAFTGTAALATPFLNMRPAGAAEITLKYAGNVNEQHPLTRGVAKAAKAITERTDGRVQIQMFPNSQLGSDADMLTQLRTGAIDFFTMSGLLLSTLVPVASVNGMGFAFSDYEDVWKVMDGDLGAHVREAIRGSRLEVMDKIWNGGFREVTSSTKPIKSPEDLKGFKIRVPVSPLWTSMFAAFGSAPVSINFGEVYTSLQTHVVDGQETPLVSIEAAKLYEVQKYCSLTNHMWDGFWFLASPRTLQRLPDDVRKIVTDTLNENALEQRKVSEQENETLQAKLTEQGMTFNKTDASQFQAALREAGFYKQWKEKYGEETWDLLEKGLGKKLA